MSKLTFWLCWFDGQVPAWASKESLEAALRKQFGDAPNLNPDDIFGEVFTCDLEGTWFTPKCCCGDVYCR